MTDKRIPLAGVLGHPIAHSKSPVLHGYWLRKYGIEGYYIPIDVPPDELADVLKMLPRMGFKGVNVTIPHKERVLELADHVTDRAALIGAANTLIFRDDGKIHGDNTDGYGFIENLRQSAPGWSARSGPATLIGAGGAARAVLSALLDAGTPEIRLTNRTRPRADQLQREFGRRVVVYDWVHAGDAMDGATLVANTTALGMSGQGQIRIPLDGLSPQAVVTDIVYTPLDTKFLMDARALGCTTVDGLGMLLFQAAPGFERWFGQRPVVDDGLRRAVLGE